MARATIGEALLGLLGPDPARWRAAESLADGDWAALDGLAADYRLQPHLHARLERGELESAVPPGVREHWRAAHRGWAMRTLMQRRDLLAVHDLLHGHGIEALPLKGSFLAWHTYPAAAERPMRDIDLLVEGGRALEAFDLLRAEGWVQAEPSHKDAEQTFRTGKHMPPLRSPDGTRLELHMHAWDPPGHLDRWMPANDDTGIAARSVSPEGAGGLRYPAPEDMLAHLVIHAAYTGHFDVGPLLLPDIDYVISRFAPDWPAWWRRAEYEGWARGAALTLAVVDHWRVPGLLEASGCPQHPPDAMIERAGELLVQPPRGRKDARLIGQLGESLRDHGLGGVIGSALGKLRGGQRETLLPEGDERSAPSYPQWLARRIREAGTAMLDPATRRAGETTATLAAWLDREDA